MVTLEDIENEINPEKQNGIRAKMAAKAKKIALDSVINNLKKMQSLLEVEQVGLGKRVITDLILGRHKLSAEEHLIVVKKFGHGGVERVTAMEHLNKAQKQFMFKQMDWDISEVE